MKTSRRHAEVLWKVDRGWLAGMGDLLRAVKSPRKWAGWSILRSFQIPSRVNLDPGSLVRLCEIQPAPPGRCGVKVRMETKKKRKSPWVNDPDKIVAAERVLRQSKGLLRNPDCLLRIISEGKSVRLPRRSDLGVMANIFEAIHRGDYDKSLLRPDVGILQRLLLFCRDETDLLTAQDASRYADALLAIAAHHLDWVRPLEGWRATSYNARRQFRSLVRHLVARYDVPDFLDAAWFEGLTPEGVKHQRWYKLIALGRNIRTMDDLPIPLTKKQAHQFLHAPDDFDILSAFRWAVIIDLGGNERLVRSILQTRIGTCIRCRGVLDHGLPLPHRSSDARSCPPRSHRRFPAPPEVPTFDPQPTG